MHLSPLAQRLLNLITGTADDPWYWPETSQLSTGLGTPVGDGDPASQRYAVDEQRLAAAARELVGFLLRDERPLYEPFPVLVAAGLAGMDAEVGARLAGTWGPIAVAEMEVLLGWDVERRALFAEAVRGRVHHAAPPLSGVVEWLGGLPGYPDFARTALEAAGARVAAIHAGEIPYRAEKAFEDAEKAALGRAVRLALLRDEPWLPALLDGLLPGVAVAPTHARTLPSQGLLFEVARAVEEHPTPEAVSALYAARRATRHAGVPKQLDRVFKRIEPALADRLEVAFRLPDGRVRQAVGEHTAVISTDGGVELSWWHGDRRLKAVPAAVRREHPEEVKRLRELAKQAQQRQTTLIRALEAGYTGETAPPYRQLEGHPVTDRLIWEFEVAPGVWCGELGMTVPDVPVRLWHPARAPVEEVRAWREAVQGKELRQPFKQAFREVYLLTPAEEATRDHSLRFDGHVVDYRRLRALFKGRGWQSNFMGPWDGGYDNGDARRMLAGGRWRVTLDHSLYDEGYAFTHEVHFDRLTDGGWHRAPLAEVPALVFSEAMRDVDLFVAAASIAVDPRWAEQGPDRFQDYWRTGSFAALPPSAEVRRDALSRLIGRTAIADRCTMTDRFLVVRGDIRTYRIHLGSANVLMEPNDAYLCIVSARDPHAGLFLPFEEDGRLALILSKAFLLANDTAITDPSIVRQLRT
ncbi:DUF4132 domain-containing protein [Planomonospora venezuelensis]|uniref:DUF4132 domain-containing protein n=1 Tax=Planomonospora venezuelensis TaxID=1999 RepID=A0A841D733_PLAVE|nr:DUF4132 domain-containing protein [Planomonospora venezuelensis]MBB5966041.1 hypothetical protein [Planomonospora venezuelensis]GIN03647.1 hypothetical protein Pve01_53050 [Planomonospora venezuelensis]